jgi:methylglutaconyl-CoA hydratase
MRCAPPSDDPSTMEQLVLIERDAARRTTTLTLNRPARRNALNLPLLDAFKSTLEAVAHDHGTRVLVIRGAGTIFCSGMDLADTASEPIKAVEAIRDVFLAIAGSPQVTIALVQGAAVAGGGGLAAACDFVVMADDAKIGFPEVKRGLVAALVAALLRRQMREHDLRELLLVGELIPAVRAEKIGLAHRVVLATELATTAHNIARSICEGGPGAIAETKSLLGRLANRSLADDFNIALETHSRTRDANEAREGSRAYLEKRKPSWCDHP